MDFSIYTNEAILDLAFSCPTDEKMRMYFEEIKQECLRRFKPQEPHMKKLKKDFLTLTSE
jgi:hypothetical protein